MASFASKAVNSDTQLLSERYMKPFLPPALFGALLFAASPSFADDSAQPVSMTPQQHQVMKDCMARQKANDSTVSKADMKSACMAEMKPKMKSGPMDSGQMSGEHGNTANEDQPAGTPSSTPPPK
jgi:hypothetical protein